MSARAGEAAGGAPFGALEAALAHDGADLLAPDAVGLARPVGDMVEFASKRFEAFVPG